MKDYRVKEKVRVRLKHVDPDDHHLAKDKDKAKEATEKLLPRLADLQETLYAEGQRAVLIVLQGLDTAGKDGVVRHVMHGLNPQSCRVISFKEPSHEELRHDFLWRVHANVPPKGWIGIFNRSHYEDILVPRVHGALTGHETRQRYKEIRQFEKLLSNNGTRVVKFFLHISKDEQRERLQARIDNPQKRWKLSPSDFSERKLWDNYQEVYEEVLGATSTDYAPWHIIPANRKWYRNWAIAKILVNLLEEMNPRFPKPDPRLKFSTLKVK